LAVDLVAYVNGKPTWEEKYYPKIAEAMKIIINKYGLPIDNGFDLWGWDMPHWQLTGFKTKYDIRKYT
jgi:lysophospholipase L1-like esterase